MSKFRVGQRVRIKWDYPVGHVFVDEGFVHASDADYTGCEAIVVRTTPRDTVWDSDLDVECYDLLVEGCPESTDSYWREDQLEPATDSYDVVSWDACVWKPEHLRVGA